MRKRCQGEPFITDFRLFLNLNLQFFDMLTNYLHSYKLEMTLSYAYIIKSNIILHIYIHIYKWKISEWRKTDSWDRFKLLLYYIRKMGHTLWRTIQKASHTGVKAWTVRYFQLNSTRPTIISCFGSKEHKLHFITRK